MSENAQDAIKAFFRKAMGDPGLQAQLKAAASLPEAEALDRAAQIAREAGYDFTAADLIASSQAGAGELTLVEDGELSDQQLDAVAGGDCWSYIAPFKTCLFLYKSPADTCTFLYTCNSF